MTPESSFYWLLIECRNFKVWDYLLLLAQLFKKRSFFNRLIFARQCSLIQLVKNKNKSSLMLKYVNWFRKFNWQINYKPLRQWKKPLIHFNKFFSIYWCKIALFSCSWVSLIGGLLCFMVLYAHYSFVCSIPGLPQTCCLIANWTLSYNWSLHFLIFDIILLPFMPKFFVNIFKLKLLEYGT